MATGTDENVSRLLERRWLTDEVFELTCARPQGYSFTPGQYAEIYHQQESREYTLISSQDDSHLQFLIRHVPAGLVSGFLAAAPVGAPIQLGHPKGYLTFSASPRPAVFVATGVGVAPFVAMARAGIQGFTMIHGSRSGADRYYHEIFEQKANLYLACLSRQTPGESEPAGWFSGRVTTYLKTVALPQICDFYLCGSASMIRDVMQVLDQRFRGSKVYYELFS